MFPPTTHTGYVDQTFTVVSFLTSVALLPLVSARVIAAEATIVTTAFMFKYWIQAERSAVKDGSAGYWAAHSMWHLMVAIGQALLVASLPDES